MNAPLNKIIIVAAPSGAGKTSVTRYLLKTMPNDLSFSISAATRARRQHETHGVDYYFISPAEFEKKSRTVNLLNGKWCMKESITER